MLLVGLMFVSVFAEILTLGAVLPFIAVLAAPDLVFQHSLASDVVQFLGINSADELVLPLTVGFVAAALLSGAVRMGLAWASTRFTFSVGSELSIEIYRRTLYQPYQVHIARSSSEVISGITNKVGNTMLGTLLPFVTLLSSLLLMTAIMLTLVTVNPQVALIAAGGFGASYGLITWFTRRKLLTNGERIAREHTQVVKALQEGLGGIRDVLLDGTQPVYCSTYKLADRPLRLAQGRNVFIAQSPRYAMEAFGIVLIASLAYGLSLRSGGIAAALPVLGALALGAQRMLPALQQGYAAWATMVGSQSLLADTIELLDQPMPEESDQPPPAPLDFKRSIRFDKVHFRYNDDAPWVLSGLSLTIAKGSRVGFVGGTGSGKSTTMDLLMGLLKPTEGVILVDERPLVGEAVRAWRRTIAHVPQSIFLADATLAENIAFGVPRHAIDMERVRFAAEQAQLAEFIESRSEGYGAYVGERGVRLSGGQRQRIGIARALYKQASVLVLDEATSALDNVTEQSVMDAIENLDRGLTILLIAHRLTTVRRCDTIVELDRGHVVAQGTYDELLQSSSSFRRMACMATSI